MFLDQALSPILEIRSFSFVINFATLASRREYLNLEKWLQDRINEHQSDFIQVTVYSSHSVSTQHSWAMDQACLAYLKEKRKSYSKYSATKGSNANNTVASLPTDALTVFFTVLQANIRFLL